LSQRLQQLDVTYNNVKLLTDMLHHYQPDTAAESDKEIMKVSVHAHMQKVSFYPLFF